MDSINIIPDEAESKELRRYYAKLSLIMIVLVVVFNGVNRLVLYTASGLVGGGFTKELVSSGRKVIASIPLASAVYSYFFPLAADVAALCTGLAITKTDLKKMLRFRGFGGKDLFDFTALSYGMATVGSFICVFIAAVVALLMGKNGAVSMEESLSQFSPTGDPLWLKVLIYLYICLIGPIMEELIFRGVLLEGLRKYGNGFGIVMSSVMFGLMHQRFIQCVPAILLGMIFAGMVVKTGSLLPSIFAHVVNNTMSAVMMVMAEGMDMQKFAEIEKMDPANIDIDMAVNLLKGMVPLLIVMGIILAVRMGSLVIGAVIAVRFHFTRRKLVADHPYCKNRTWKYLFTSVPWILLLLYLTVVTLMTIV